MSCAMMRHSGYPVVFFCLPVKQELSLDHSDAFHSLSDLDFGMCFHQDFLFIMIHAVSSGLSIILCPACDGSTVTAWQEEV